jgi:hypothetical protein
VGGRSVYVVSAMLPICGQTFSSGVFMFFERGSFLLEVLFAFFGKRAEARGDTEGPLLSTRPWPCSTPLIPAGALPNSQPPTPGATPLSVMKSHSWAGPWTVMAASGFVGLIPNFALAIWSESRPAGLDHARSRTGGDGRVHSNAEALLLCSFETSRRGR